MFRRTFIYFAVFILGCHPICSGQVKLTLAQAIDSTLTRNLQIKKAQLDATLSIENIKQSKNNLLPILTASPQASANWGRTLDVSTYNYLTQRVLLMNGNLSTQLILFQGGILRNQIIQNKLLFQIDQSNIAKLRYDLTISTVMAYVQILTDQDLLDAAQQQIKIAKENVAKVQLGLTAGNKSVVDVSQAQAQQAGAEYSAATIQNQLEIDWSTLKQLVQMPDMAIELHRPDLNKVSISDGYVDTVGLIEMARLTNPDIRLASLQTKAAYHAITIAKGALYPTISIFGSIGTSYSNARTLITPPQQVGFDTVGVVGGTNQPVLSPALRSTSKKYAFFDQLADNIYQSAGFSLQIPIFNHSTARVNIRKAKIMYNSALINQQVAVDNMTRVLRLALSDLHTAQKRLEVAQKGFEAAKKLNALSEKRYQAGLLNALDFNIAITTYNRSEFDLIDAKYNLLFKRQVIDFYLGKPMTESGL
ncbi:TolC family protein [Mucilaginibacter daejeonensis]|uniref:TolC family protein n=1 Tax=Mucilaginibacter daejeonensis TaxID=398049 RepID=UPI001D177407|nr:TolC family protein [Mucilaginibacter daejeonensis]UEG51465.1 TolC family protein [Mucilaginibacter daejeonensis]